jgi:hypothetical protein
MQALVHGGGHLLIVGIGLLAVVVIAAVARLRNR